MFFLLEELHGLSPLGKGKVVPVHTMEVYWRSGGVVHTFLTLTLGGPFPSSLFNVYFYKKLSKHFFCENWPSYRDALCKGLNELCCPYFSLDVAEIQYIHISPCTTIDQL